jgi:hypothetical protein
LSTTFLSSEEPNTVNLNVGQLILFVEKNIKTSALVYIWQLGLVIFPMHLALLNLSNFVILTILTHHIVSWQDHMKKTIENIHYRSRKNVGKKFWPSDTIQGVSFCELKIKIAFFSSVNNFVP